MSESPHSSRPNGEQGPDRRGRLEQSLAAVLDRVIEDLRQHAGEKFRQSEELDRLVEELEAHEAPASTAVGDAGLGALLHAVARIDGQAQQSEVLRVLVDEARHYARRVAFFLNRPEGVVGWGGAGFGEGDSRLAGLEFDHGGQGTWSRFGPGCGVLRLTAADCARLSAQLDVQVPADGVVVPFVLSGQLAGALYADSADGDEALQVEGLQLLTHAAAEALETLPFRGSEGSPALRHEPAADEPADEPAAAVVDEVEEVETESTPDTSAGAAEAVGAALVAGAAAIGTAGESADEPASEESNDEATTLIATKEELAEAELDQEAKTEPISLEPIVDQVDAEESSADEPATVEVGIRDQVDEVTEEAGDDASAAAEASTEVVIEATDAIRPDELGDESASAIDASLQTAATAEATFESGEPTEDSSTDAQEVDLFQTADGVPLLDEPEVEVEVELEDSSELWLEEEEESEPVPVAGRTSDPSPLETAAAGQQTVRIDAIQLEDPTSFAPLAEEDPEEEPEDLLAEDDTSPVPVLSDDDTHVMEHPKLDPQLETGFELEPERSSGAPLGSEDETVLGMPAVTSVPPPSAGFAAPATPAPVPVPSPTQSGSTEVAPPLDLTGPGLAFSAGRQTSKGVAPGEEALHEEARRLARLLVSEIKLYNEEIIEEGRRDRNIYERLREDIDRSRQMYDERIDARVREHEDYFLQEMVRLLAGGDATLLGL